MEYSHEKQGTTALVFKVQVDQHVMMAINAVILIVTDCCVIRILLDLC